MSKTVGKIKAVLGLDKRGFEKGLDESKKKTNAFSGALKKIAGAAAAAFAVKKVLDFGKASVNAANIQLQAETQLLTALKGREDVQQELIKQAQDLQKTTLFGDEETIRAQSLIAAFVKEKDQIKEVIPLVQDLAAAKGMDLAGAADLVSKTLGSSTNALSRYGIEVTGAVGSQERLKSLTEGLTEAFGGQAAAAALAGSGPLVQLKNAWGDIQEEIGKRLLPVINKVAKWFLSVLPGLGNGFSKMRSAIVGVINYFIDLYNESILFRAAVSGIKFAFKQTWAAVKLVFQNMVDGFKTIGELVKFVFNPKNWGKGFGSELKKIVSEGFGNVKNNVIDFGKTTAENFKGAVEETLRKDKIKLIDLDAKKEGEQVGKDFAEGFNTGVSVGGGGEGVAKPQELGTVGSEDVSIGLGITDEDLERLGLLNFKAEELNNHIFAMQESTGTLGEIWENVFTNNEFILDSLVNSVDGLMSAFEDLFGGSSKGFKDLAANAVKAIGKIIIAEKARAIAGMIASESKKGLLGLITATVGIAAVTGFFASKIPKLAGGGVIPGGYPNDSYPAMLSSGEVVTPPGALPGGGMGGGELVARVSGRDLEFVLKKYETHKNSIT